MPRRIPVAAFLVSFLLLPLTASAADAVDTVEPAWLDEVAPLIAAAEREAFLGLADPVQRDEFVQRFWQVRDPFPQTERNELREGWSERLAQARARWGDLQDDRARALLLRGEPGSSFEASCPEVAGGRPVEVWTWEAGFGEKYRMALVFLKEGEGPARLWRPGPDAPDLRPAADCESGRGLAREMKWIRAVGDEQYRAMIERALARPRPEPRDWYARFTSEPAEPAGATGATGATEADTSLHAGLEVDYPARLDENRVVRVLMTVPSDSFGLPEPAGAPEGTRELLVTGQVLGGRGVLDDFRYRFQVDPSISSEPVIPLVFERYLRPGLYRLRVKLVDLFTKRFFQDERELTVPGLADSASPAAAAGLERLYAEADAELAADRPGVRLVRPGDGPLAGETRFEARVEGPDSSIRKVAFLLDGRTIYTRTRPPYQVTLDLGSVPRLQKLAVEGLNGQGKVIDRDELVLNAGAQRFSVRLLDPRPGRAYRSSLRARVQVEPPSGESVDRVELWLNETRISTIYQPPYAQPVLLPPGQEVGYVRAVAYLRDGRAAEDTVLLNTPGQPDEMAVRLVDLFTTVVDPAGRPVQSVEPGLFSVLEDGVPQRLRLVEAAGAAPVRVVTLIDNSLSMRESLEKTRAAALGFLRRVLRPTDQAAVITFNRAPRVAVRLTNDLEELEEGLTGLLAEDQTSLYDSLAYSLQYLSGVKGQRAILLLSDGMDRSSRLSYDQVLEVARRTGIAVYTIGLGLEDGGRGEAGKKLAKVAAETGGRSWFVTGTPDLDGVYAQIERELRSQYHLAYQSTNNSPDTGFRAVKVELTQKGLEARTISGYYP